MVTRQLPQIPELLELLQFQRPDLNARRRRLGAALSIGVIQAALNCWRDMATFDSAGVSDRG